MNSMKRQKGMIMKDELAKLVGAQYPLKRTAKIAPSKHFIPYLTERVILYCAALKL